MNLKGRVIVITGASSGIGEAMARQFGEAGAGVALLARRYERIEQLANQINDKGGHALAIAADVTDIESIRDAKNKTLQEFGKVDGLVNNAGQMLLSPFEQRKVSEWRRMIEINLLGAITTTEVFLEPLLEKGGDIVNISSVAGRKARAGSSIYSATKWGMNGWSEGLRQELVGKNVRVIVVEPGAVDTELSDHISDPNVKEATKKMYNEVEALTADDIASITAFAISQPSRVSINELLIRPSLQQY